jgi:putative transposase
MKARSAEAQSALAAPEAAWAEAVRREAVVRPLAGASRLGNTAVAAAARKLGLSVPRVYGLLRTFRSQPVTALLLPTKPGPGARTRST